MSQMQTLGMRCVVMLAAVIPAQAEEEQGLTVQVGNVLEVWEGEEGVEMS